MYKSGPNKCSDKRNCNMLDSVLSISKLLKRENMQSDPEIMFSLSLEQEYGPIFLRYCPFCGFEYGSEL